MTLDCAPLALPPILSFYSNFYFYLMLKKKHFAIFYLFYSVKQFMMASNEEGDLILFCGGFLYTDKESKKGNLEEKTSD